MGPWAAAGSYPAVAFGFIMLYAASGFKKKISGKSPLFRTASGFSSEKPKPKSSQTRCKIEEAD